MFIGYCKINIFLPQSLSLKRKRQIILGTKERMRRKFNIAVAERPLDKWQIAELSFVCVNYTRRYVEEQLFKVEEYLRLQGEFHIIDCEKQVF